MLYFQGCSEGREAAYLMLDGRMLHRRQAILCLELTDPFVLEE